MKTKITILVFLFFRLLTNGQQQIFTNKMWQTNNANPGTNEQIGCGVDPSGNFVYFTNTKPGSTCDMSLNYVVPTGTVAWTNSCTSCPISDDYGADLVFDASGNIYVCGAKSNGTNLDYFVAKYSPSGTQLWAAPLYNGTGNKDDAATDIELDGSGNIYVTGTSYGTVLTDIVTMKYNSAGVQQWAKRYDFNNLPEIGVGLKLDNTGNVFVYGSAGNSMTDADFIIIKYDPATGNQLAIRRDPTTGTGLDMPSEMVIDNSNNIFVVGTSQNGSNKDIKTLALTNYLAPMWTKYVDKSGQADEGFGIVVNSNSDIIVTGYSTKANNGTELVAIKYNSTSGTIPSAAWPYTKSATIATDIAKGRKVKKDASGNIILAGEIEEGTKRNLYVIALDQNANPLWERKINDGIGNNYARNLAVMNNQIFVNGISDNGTTKQVTTAKITTVPKINAVTTPTSGPSYVANELIIQFDARSVVLNPFTSKDIQSGALTDFVLPKVINKMDSIYPIPGGWKLAKAHKVFLAMTNADTVSLSREGILIEQKDLWPTLAVSISLKDIKAAKDSLSKLYPWLRYAEFNHLFNLFSANPNDQYFQSGDLNGFTSASHGVNLPLAWNYGVGTSNVKIGIFDTGINYKHEDFGNGTFAGSKLLDGKNFLTNSATSSETNPDNDGHGTACSGIIGALSNNNKGVAGVAGGDVSVSNTGCSILSMRLYDGTNQANAATIANAITEGVSYNPNTNFGYGLDVSNHSYGVEVNNLVVQQAVSTSYANSSIFVAASGNYPQVTAINALTYPASYSDPMVLKIGANDLSGDRAPFSVYDNNMDLVAPGTHDQYISLDAFANNGYTDIFTSGLYSGSQIDGTSFAAPHVAGVAGLMKSVHNTSMGAPANLAPEDVEIIMKNNATDVNAPGYDIYTGYGRLNAGGAVSKIAFPRYIIRHPTPVSAVQTIGPLNQQIVLANNVNGVAAGVYFADRYQMTWSYSELFPPGVQILDWWERASSEVGVDGQVPVSGSRNIQYSGVIVLGNAYLATATAFAWNITQDIIGNTMNAWIPTTPAGLRSAISIYAFDPNAAVGFKDVVKEDPYFSIYPNPTKDLLTIKYGSIKDEKATLEVWDSFGTQITKLPINTNQADGITINMSHLANGVYFCKLTGDNLTITRKFVKVD